jgi:hypothetical protein
MDGQRTKRKGGGVNPSLRLLIWLGGLGCWVQALLLYQREGAPAAPRVAVFLGLGVLFVATQEAWLFFRN